MKPSLSRRTGFTFILATLASAVLLLHTTPARAAYLIDYLAPADGSTNWINGSIGYDFTVGSSEIVVNALGYWDDGGDGLAVDHQVGIFLTEAPNFGVELLSVTVPAGSSASIDADGFRYVSLPVPVALAAGTHYKVVGSANGSDWWGYTFDNAKLSFSSDFEPGSVYPGYRNDGTFGATTDGIGAQVYAVNLEYTVVPEPKGGTLFLMGLVATAIFLRRRGSAA